MSTLYQIVDALLELEEDLVDSEGVLTPQAEAALEALEGSREQKYEWMYAYVLERQAQAVARRAEAQRLQRLAHADDRRAEGLAKYMVDQMLRLGGKPVQTSLGRLQPQRNGTPSLVPITATEALPSSYQRVYVEPNTMRALELYREVMQAQLHGLKGKALEDAKPRARAAATQAVRDVGFEVRQGYSLRAYS